MASELQTGLWSFYYSNGELKTRGEYSSKVHTYSGHADFELNQGKVIPGWISCEYLKNDEWEYFDEKGCLSKTETYKNGQLVLVVDYILLKD